MCTLRTEYAPYRQQLAAAVLAALAVSVRATPTRGHTAGRRLLQPGDAVGEGAPPVAGAALPPENETLITEDNWQQVVARTALPDGTILINTFTFEFLYDRNGKPPLPQVHPRVRAPNHM